MREYLLSLSKNRFFDRLKNKGLQKQPFVFI